jgi:hypothetical protein
MSHVSTANHVAPEVFVPIEATTCQPLMAWSRSPGRLQELGFQSNGASDLLSFMWMLL